MTDLVDGVAQAAAEPAAIANVQTAETVTPPSSPMERMTQTMSEAYDKINPPRENGKFAAKDGVNADPPPIGAEPAAKADTEIKDQNPIEVVTEPPKTAAIDPPISWSAEKKAMWPSLSPDAQSYIAQREGEAHKRISELGQQVKAVEPIRNVVEHYSETFRRNGLDPADGIARMLNVNAMLESDPVGTIHKIAEAYGVNLASAASGEQAEGQESAMVRSLQSQIQQLTSRLNETHSRVTARDRSEQEQAQATLASLVDEFSKDKTDFAEIEPDIVAHIQAIQRAEPGLKPEKVLEKAYDNARWANPNTRTKLLAEQEKQRAERQTEEQKKKATEAKKIGSLNVKSTSASPAKKGSWEQTLREVGERIA